jgi:glycosyltransferase involved in cell wall biosynthesis
MRIALAHPRLDHRGGAENVVCWMARGLIERGHDVVVATQRFSLERWDEKDWQGIPVVVLRAGALDRYKLRAARKRSVGHRLRAAIGARELIVAHNFPSQVWATVAARRMPGTRVVWYCEEPSTRLHGRETMPRFTAALEDLDRHSWLRDAKEQLAQGRARDARHTRLAVDLQLDRDAAARLDLALGNSAFTARGVSRVYGIAAAPCILGLPEPAPAPGPRGAPYVAWITSAIPHKNAYGFLEALRIAVHELGARDLRVRAVGLRGEAFERRIAALGLGDVVECGGWQSDADLNALIAGCRLLAYPPIEEPFGLVPLQAMAHGRPVLAANLGGPAETVVHGKTGLLADPLDPRDLAGRLVELWSAPARCDALGAAGHERYRAEFTFEQFLDRFEDLAFGRSRRLALQSPDPPRGGARA